MEMIDKANALREMGFEVVADLGRLPYFQRGDTVLTFLDVNANPWEGVLAMIQVQDEIAHDSLS